MRRLGPRGPRGRPAYDDADAVRLADAHLEHFDFPIPEHRRYRTIRRISRLLGNMFSESDILEVLCWVRQLRNEWVLNGAPDWPLTDHHFRHCLKLAKADEGYPHG